ncbi:MAG: hypothetical protein WAQ25_00660 [Candidatus Saccharimonas sp.]
MFRKLVSNLAFSPALVGQLGFYAKRLKKEEATRRIGLIFTALALVVQFFAVFSPAEATNSSNPSNFISGGVNSKSDYLAHYDANTNNIRDLFNVLGISRANIENTTLRTLNSKNDGLISWGLTPRYSYAQGERSYTIRTSSGSTRSYYYRPLTLWDSLNGYSASGSNYAVYVGQTDSGMWFGLMNACGNLALKVYPPEPKCPSDQIGTYPNCTPPPKMCKIPGKTHLPEGDPGCKLDPVAKCDSLRITKILDKYQFDAKGYVANGPTITGYTYVVKKDGKVIETHKSTSAKDIDQYLYPQKTQGTYTVELTVNTSTGNVTGADCVGTFTIPAPKLCPQNPKLTVDSPECQPCPGDSTLWIKDPQCKASIVNTKTASNITQGNVDATKTTANASDKIIYSLEIVNRGKLATDVTVVEPLDDVLEYAQIVESGGGSFDASKKTVTWPKFTLKPGEKQVRMFTVQLLDKIPAMGIGTSDKSSYDCRMINTFGNAVEIAVNCPVQKKVIEETVAELPHTGPRENMIFAASTLSIVAYFYARARQVKKEVRLIRRDFNAGTI